MNSPICRHIKTNGEQCGSLRLRDADYCYFHHRALKSHNAMQNIRRPADIMKPLYNRAGRIVGMELSKQPPLDLGLLEDRTSVQMAISTVLNALAANRMEQRRATALLYGLQLASSNCPAIRHEHSQAPNPIHEAIDTPEGLTLALENLEGISH